MAVTDDDQGTSASTGSENEEGANKEVAQQQGCELEGPPEPKLSDFGIPLASYVKGGGAVKTTDYERQLEAEFRDAERRRDESAFEKSVSRVPVEEGGAKLFTHNLADTGSSMLPKGEIELTWVNSKGEPLYWRGRPITGVADLLMVVDPAYIGERMLEFFCIECIQRGSHLQNAVLQVRQSNRRWYLDDKHAGEAFIDEEGQMHKSAGMVMDSDLIKCPVCNHAYRIDKNKVWPA